MLFILISEQIKLKSQTSYSLPSLSPLGAEKEIWKGWREVLFLTGSALTSVFQKERISVTRGMFKKLSLPSVTRYALVHGSFLLQGFSLTLPQQRTMYNGCACRLNYGQGLRTPEFLSQLLHKLTVWLWIRYFFPGLSFSVKGSVVPLTDPFQF